MPDEIKPDQAKQEYTAKQITVLEGLEPVRKRPGMYIGGTGIDGLHHLIWEVVDNGIDEAMAGHATEVIVELQKNNRVLIVDNGRGIPIDIHKQTKKSAVETVLTTLHAGGKFGEGSYKVSGGLHGVGVSVVNALSSFMRAEVKRDNRVYTQEYARGKTKTPLKTTTEFNPYFTKFNSGTAIYFEADPEVFEKIEYNWKTILDHLRQQAYLTKNIKIKLIDLRAESPVSYSFYFEGGISAYVKHLNKNKIALNEPPIYVEKTIDDILVEVAVQYADDYNEHIYTFANNIFTPEGGTHLTGFRSAITRAINDYGKKNELSKNGENILIGDDTREGLTAVISVKLKNPQFEGQTKAKLGNPEVRTAVESAASLGIVTYLEEHPNESRKILEKVTLSARARLAAKAARDTVIRKGALEGMTLPGKLADCSSRRPEESELYLVEGDSAGGSAKSGRDRRFQAILPLRGKILNVERARLDKMLASEEIKNFIVALGAGVAETWNAEKIRYHRVIIMTDADVDGSHIRTLLLTLIYRHFREVIDKGFLYIAQPPLYALTSGKEKKYFYTEEQKEAYLKGVKDRAKINIQRYKGLGEMNPEQLWETTMNPENRILKQIAIEDAERADEIFSMLMGDEVPPRKKFIQTQAKNVKNLDI